MQGKYSRGDKVVITALGNSVGIVDGKPKESRDRLFYPVSIDPGKPSPYYPEEALELFIAPKSVEELLSAKEFSGADEFIRFFIYRKLEKPLADNLYTFYASRTEFQVHQFKPVVKFLNTLKQRLLLADEVGLGKTIEAGIILTEMSARLGELSRVLVVCPAMLTAKWKRELYKRFSLDFEVTKRDGFRDFLRRYGEYGQAEKLKAIVSIQSLRSRNVIDDIYRVAPHLDLVIVDEAHYMRNPETMSSDLGEALSEHSDAVLFLSATPLHLGTPDLFNLLRILIPEDFTDFSLFERIIEPNQFINAAMGRLHDPKSALEQLRRVERTSQKARFLKSGFYQEAVEILRDNKELTRDQALHVQKLLVELNSLSYVFTRTKKKDVAVEFPTREARVIRVEFTPEEIEFYDAVTDFVAERFTAKFGSGQGISFAVIMPQRQVASCIQAMKENLDHLIQKPVVQGPLPDDGDVIDPSADEDPEWNLTRGEVRTLRNLKQQADRLKSVDTKFDRFLEALRALDEEDPTSKILVFAFFKKTLAYLGQKLASTEYGGRVAIIHGDIPPKEREKIIRKFRQSDDIKILLSSEVAGEGLDFEFCNVIFNYDLPWNPMRVEQRIGRLDRYGQQHDKILIYNFSMVGTVDDEILRRLYTRINIFERYIGDLDAILGDQITQLTKDLFNASLTYEQKVEKIEKVAENLETRQKELEEFESESQRFIGQDEYFNRELSSILETSRFVGPEEVEFLLRAFLKKQHPRTTLRAPKKGRENVFVLKANNDFRDFVQRNAPASEITNEFRNKLSWDGGVLVTFNDQEACRDEQLEFITIHHPIIKAIKRHIEESREEMPRTSALQMGGSGDEEGTYLFFIYMLERSGLKKELVLVSVLVSLESGDVHIKDDICDKFLGSIVEAEDLDKGDIEYDEGAFEGALTDAGEYLEMIREEEEANLRRRNDALIDNQIESIRQAAEIKITKAKQIIGKLKKDGKTDTDPVVRLHLGRIRNLDLSKDQMIQDLDMKRPVAVAFELVAGGVVKIG